MNNKSLSILLLLSLLLSSCTALIESGLRDSLIGTWEVFEMVNETTGVTTNIHDDPILIMFENKFCNGVTFNSDDSFETFYSDGTNALEPNSGTWLYEFGDITLTFEDESSWFGGFAISEDVLTLPDTIAGQPRTFMLSKVE